RRFLAEHSAMTRRRAATPIVLHFDRVFRVNSEHCRDCHRSEFLAPQNTAHKETCSIVPGPGSLARQSHPPLPKTNLTSREDRRLSAVGARRGGHLDLRRPKTECWNR